MQDITKKIKNCYYLDVLAFREISNKISSDFKVIHESPQILVIENAKCVYHTSRMKLIGIIFLNYNYLFDSKYFLSFSPV